MRFMAKCVGEGREDLNNYTSNYTFVYRVFNLPLRERNIPEKI